jgi:hypothetical protein
MKLLLPSEGELNHLEMIDLYPYITWHENKRYFDLPAGKEHYRLLAHLSLQFPRGHTFLDVGTYTGMSAMALAYNRTCKVVSFDLVSTLPNQIINPQNRSNIEFKVENILSNLSSHLKDCLCIFLDTNHDGTFEHQFYTALKDHNYKGILLLDDIHLNNSMEFFWKSISHKKIDLTSLGHWSGTGAVVFDEEVIDLY